MPYASSDRVIADVWKTVLRPQDHLTVDEWADRERVLTARASPEPGRWNTSRVPYLREIMRAYTDPGVRRIVMMFGTQCAKTEALLNCLMFTIDRDAYPSMLVLPNAELARSVNTDRFLPTFRETPAVRRHMSDRKWDAKALQIRFDTMDLWLSGANSAANLASRPIGRLFCDEIDKFPLVIQGRGGTEGSALDLARERTSAFPDAKEINTSTPSDEGVGIHREYLQSDQAQYHVPCPHCGLFQALRFGSDGAGGIRWPRPGGEGTAGASDTSGSGVGTDLSEADHADFCELVRRQAWYECEKCGQRINSASKAAMLSAGRWVRRGQEIRDGEVVGTPPESSIRGFHLPQLYSPFKTFGDSALGFIAARGEPDRAWINSVLAEPWRLPGARLDQSEIIRVASAPPEGEDSYRRGTVPRQVLALTAAVDVQKDHVYVEVVGWGEREGRWLIDWARIACPEIMESVDKQTGEVRPVEQLREEGANWARVEMWLGQQWPRSGTAPHGQPNELGIVRGCCDLAYRTAEVYAFCRRMGPNWTPIRSFESGVQVQPHRMTTIDRMPDGRPIPGGLSILGIAIEYWASEVHSRMMRKPPAHGAWRWPSDVGPEYLRQLTAEERVAKQSSRGVEYEWRLRPGRRDNHFLDTARYNLALADFSGLRALRATPEADPAPPRRLTVGGR